MPSLIITGHPCTLKTAFAHLLTQRALRHPSAQITHALHISESTALAGQYSKAQCYQNSSQEKTVRAALKSAFDRAVSHGSTTTKTSLVVLDSLNYIKGYRYELYCISKAAGERHGVIWIMGSAADEACAAGSSPSGELAKERNWRRKQRWQENPPSAASSDGDVINDGYYENDATMDELVMRFEPPDERNRWEKPLYKVDMSRVLPWDKNGTLKQSSMASNETNGDSRLTQSVASVTLQDDRPAVQPIKSAAGFKRSKKSKPRDATPQSTCIPSAGSVQTPSSAQVTSMASRNLAASSSNTTNNNNSNSNTDMTTIEQVIDDILNSFFIDVQPLKEGLSTLTHSSAESNVLNLVDATSQRINIEIVKAQKRQQRRQVVE